MNDITTNDGGVRSSEGIGKLVEALAAAQGEFEEIKKEKIADAGSYKYNYADISDVLAAVRPALSKHGIAFSQPTVIEGGTIYIRTRLMHKSGEWMESEYPVATYANTPPQKVGAALTYARRYAGCSILGVAAEEDVDASDNAATTTEKKATGRQLSRSSREPPAVVQSGNGQKPLPPTVGEKNGADARPFTYTDRYGKSPTSPYSEDSFVHALSEELQECGKSGIKKSVDALLNNNADEMKALSEPSRQAAERALEEANKLLRAAAVEDDPQKGEPGPMI